MSLSSLLFWVTSVLSVWSFRHPVGIPFAALLWTAWFFRRALEHARRPPKSRVSFWFRNVTTLHLESLEEPYRRMVPFGLSLLAYGARLADAPGATALFAMAVFSAAAILGYRAGVGQFTARRYMQDLVFGAQCSLVAAALGVAGLPFVSPGLARLTALVIVFSCGMIAVSEEPLRLTRPPSRRPTRPPIARSP